MAVISSIPLAVAALGQQPPAAVSQLPTPGELCQDAYEAHDDVWLAARTVDGTQLAGRRGLASLRADGERGFIIVVGGDFRNADLRGLRLRDVCFTEGADFSGSDWRGARADGILFAGTSLAGAKLGGARLRGVVFDNLDLDNVDAAGAQLQGGRIVGGYGLNLEGLRLEGADLTGFFFDCGLEMSSGCPAAERLDLRRANLTRASLTGYWGLLDVTGARLDRTQVGLHQLRDLAGAVQAGPLIVTGGAETIEITPDEYRQIVPRFRDSVEDGEGFTASRPPSWLRPGAVAMFITSPIGFDPAFQSDPLFRRLIPVIVGSAPGRVVVTVNADGTIDAVGDAIGGNIHICTLSGQALRLDPATGWFSGPHTPTDEVPAEWQGRPMPVLRFWEDRAEVYQYGHPSLGGDGDPRFSDYASCGARAGFETLVRLPVPEAEARALGEALREMIGS